MHNIISSGDYIRITSLNSKQQPHVKLGDIYVEKTMDATGIMRNNLLKAEWVITRDNGND